MKKNIMIASCPLCGNVLFRGAISDVEIKCSRCKEDLKVELTGDHVSVTRQVRMEVYAAELRTS